MLNGCHHYELSGYCWIVDPTMTHFVDIIVRIDMSEVMDGTRDCESVIMIRDVTRIDADADHFEWLGTVR